MTDVPKWPLFIPKWPLFYTKMTVIWTKMTVISRISSNGHFGQPKVTVNQDILWPKWPFFFTKMTVIVPKWPLWTKMTVIDHQNDRCGFPKWPLCTRMIVFEPKWPLFIPKWPLFLEIKVTVIWTNHSSGESRKFMTKKTVILDQNDRYFGPKWPLFFKNSPQHYNITDLNPIS